MTNTEIDRKLALAIGWKPESISDVELQDGSIIVMVIKNPCLRYRFSHQGPTVILPIMERHDCFPHKLANGEWVSNFQNMPGVAAGVHTNPRTAAALAVIKAKDMGLI
jgi:hypothetical protein